MSLDHVNGVGGVEIGDQMSEVVSERLQLIEVLFHAALARPVDAREAFLADACGGDEALQREVSELLAITSGDDLLARSSAPGPTITLATGSHLGPYEIEALIGAGGMGEVYRARDTRLHRTVALKLLPAHLRANADLRVRFEREARAVGSLTHPNICALHDLSHEGKLDFLVMEYADGGTLADALRNGPLPIATTLRVGASVALALAAAHAKGVVHRDVKPSNIVLTADGVPKLVDFGLALTGTAVETPTTGGDSRMTRTGIFAGTPQYMSPEQVIRQPLDSRTDLFSLGLVLFECVTGRRPFDGGTLSASLKNLMFAAPRSMRALRAEVPAELERLVLKCLEKDAATRQISASELASSLTRLERNPRHEASRTRRFVRWTAAATVLLVASAGIAWERRDAPVTTRPTTSDATLAFHPRDSVLMSTFDNRTGDRQFDRTIENALEYELNNSPYVTIVPPDRVDAALKLMLKPADTTVDAATGREVALRDGDTRFVIGGDISRFGAGYVMTVRVIEPSTGATVATTREESAGLDGVQRTVHRLSNWIRLTLGEAPVAVMRDDARLEKVTTPSLRAVQLYSEARRVFDRGEMSAAEAMFTAALAEDPGFASAHIWLAWALANQRRPQDVIVARAKRAADLASTTTERERYWILASYYLLTGQNQLALGQLEALTQRFPNDFWAVRNLSVVYMRLGRADDALEVAPRVADIQREDFVAQAMAAANLFQAMGIDQAQPYIERSERLLSKPVSSSQGWGDAAKVWLLLLPAHQHWAAGRASEAAKVLDSVKNRPEFQLDPSKTLHMLGTLRLALGQLTLADHTFDRITDANQRALDKSAVALARNDMPTVIALINAAKPTDFAAVSLLVEAGDLDGAQRLLDKMPDKDPTHSQWTAEQIKEARGDTDQITRALKNGVPWARVMTGVRTYYYSETLARAAARTGNVNDAIRILEQIRPVGARAYAFFTQSGCAWMRTQILLADLYRETDQIDKARAIERGLLSQLAVADSDYPLLVELRRRAAAATADASTPPMQRSPQT
jgi:serine/threonine protein kinase